MTAAESTIGFILIDACAAHSFAFAVFHGAFWVLFDWPSRLARTNAATRAITQILNLRLIYVFAGIGVLCMWLPHELLSTRIGHAVLGGMSLFWIGRTIEQFVFLRVDSPFVHALTASFVIGAMLFSAPLLIQT